MKIIDRYIIKTFVGPFVLTFFITLFIIVMQFLWKYVDDMIGKGLEWYVITELLFYASASFVPLALPLAVLLSSIMTFGGLGESYELVAFKSSGISLARFVRPVLIASFFVAVGAFFFSNNLLPKANLKFGSLLYDIRQQKPALNIIPGIFYGGIEGYSIRVNKKDPDNKTIYGVLIYDHTSGRGNDVLLTARKGEMLMSEDERYLIFRLYDGFQYKEVKPRKGESAFDHVRSSFTEWEKVFDLSQFNLNRTDESFFKDHYQMLNIRQLEEAMDSLEVNIERKKEHLLNYVQPYFFFLRENRDSISQLADLILEQENFYQRLENLPEKEKVGLFKRALNNSRNVKSFTSVAERDNRLQRKNLSRHQIEWHRKFTLSIACLVLFIIGAPLGAIIRKGGLGMPLVMSILFFVVFHVFSMSGEKMAEEGALTPLIGMWMATIALTPIGIFLLYKASNDSVILNTDAYLNALKKILKIKQKT